MTDTSTLASPDARLATIARLNDRCRQGLDRTARIGITRACLGTFTENRAAEIVAQAGILAALRCYRFSEEEAGNGTGGASTTGARRCTSGSTITTPRSNTPRRIPPTPASPGAC